jgi:hypothetical protein
MGMYGYVDLYWVTGEARWSGVQNVTIMVCSDVGTFHTGQDLTTTASFFKRLAFGSGRGGEGIVVE